jgi:hypothetical protein
VVDEEQILNKPRQAKLLIETLREHDNRERPHMSLELRPLAPETTPSKLLSRSAQTWGVVLNMGEGHF